MRFQQGITLYAAVGVDGVRYYHTGNQVPVTLPFFQPVGVRGQGKHHGAPPRPSQAKLRRLARRAGY